MLDATLGFGQRLTPTFRGAQLLGQLITTTLAIKLILTPIDLLGLGQVAYQDPDVTPPGHDVWWHRDS